MPSSEILENYRRSPSRSDDRAAVVHSPSLGEASAVWIGVDAVETGAIRLKNEPVNSAKKGVSSDDFTFVADVKDVYGILQSTLKGRERALHIRKAA